MFLVRAEVAELVDALGSGSSPGFRVGVRVSPSAPLIINIKSTVAMLCFFMSCPKDRYQQIDAIADRTILAKLALPMVMHFTRRSVFGSSTLITAFSENPFAASLQMLP